MFLFWVCCRFYAHIVALKWFGCNSAPVAWAHLLCYLLTVKLVYYTLHSGKFEYGSDSGIQVVTIHLVSCTEALSPSKRRFGFHSFTSREIPSTLNISIFNHQPTPEYFLNRSFFLLPVFLTDQIIEPKAEPPLWRLERSWDTVRKCTTASLLQEFCPKNAAAAV